MADVAIDSTITGGRTARGMRAAVFVSADVGYWFYSQDDFAYSKTTDGGATWSAPVQIKNVTTLVAYDVWFDQWTPGDSGTLIHLWYFDTTNDDVFYRTLDTNGDTLGTERTVFNGATAVAGRGAFVSGTKTRSGYLYCCYDIDAGAERGLHRSTDGGTTWSANLSTTFLEATTDEVLLFPASNTGDDNDCWAIYLDASADALTLKMWDSSAASESESATIQAHIENTSDGTGQHGYSASVRHSDGHLILAAVSERDTATADHQVWDINGTGSITGLTAITTNIDDHYYPAVFIDQTTNDLYVAFNGLRDGSETLGTTTKVYYTKSTDDGTTWSAGSTTYMDDAATTVFQIWAPLMGARFYVGWLITGSGLRGNKVNSLTFSSAQTITASAIGSGEAFGTTKLNFTLVPSGVATAEAFGTAKLNFTLAPAGIATAAAFGTTVLSFRLFPSSVASAEAFGSAIVSQGGAQTLVGAGAIGSAEAVGAAKLNFHLFPAGISSAQAFGTAQLNFRLLPASIAGAGAFGTAALVQAQTVSAAGAIASGQAFGAASLAFRLGAVGVASLEAFGAARLNFTVFPFGVASAETVPLPTVVGGAPLVTPAVGKYAPEHRSAFADLGAARGFSAEHASALRDLEDAGL